MAMPGRNGKTVTGGGWAQGTTKVNGVSISETLTIDTRTDNTPTEYKAATSIEFTDGFISSSTDEFTAFIADASNTSTSTNGNASGSSLDSYRYGFNGKENDKDISEGGQDYGARIYDGRIGRWLSTDPLQIKYPGQSPFVGFNNNPIYFIDPDGKDGIASTTKNAGTKKSPHIVTITANYYYTKATEAQLTAMKSVQTELAGGQTVQKDGQYYKVVIAVNFIKDDNPTERAKKDVGVNGASYGNVLKIEDGAAGNEFGHASNRVKNEQTISEFANLVTATVDKFNDENQTESYQAIFRNVLKEEVLHNLGGLHQDGDAVPIETVYAPGHSTITEKEKPASENRYTSSNAAAIFNRIDKPIGTDAKEDPVDKKGKVIEPKLRDNIGTVGQVKTDTKNNLNNESTINNIY